MALDAGTRLGPYEIVELRGKGGKRKLALILLAVCLLWLPDGASALQVEEPPALPEEYAELLKKAEDLLRAGEAKKAIKLLQEAFKKGHLEEAVAVARAFLEEMPQGPVSDQARILVCHAPLSARLVNDPSSSSPSSASASTPVFITGDVQKPVKIFDVAPKLPAAASKARTQGRVVLETIINKGGCITDVKVLEPLPNGLTESAIASAEQWVYRPATLNGRPVTVYFNLTINFQFQ